MRLLEYRRSTKLRDADSILRRIVINLSINHYHHEQATPVVSESIEQLDRRGILVDPAPDPARTLAAEQQLHGAVSLLSAMSPRTCQIFIAQRGGYSYEEIASAFSIKARTVEKHVATAALMLIEILSGDFATP